MSNQLQIRQEIISIINEKSPPDAVVQMIKMMKNITSEEVKNWIRDPIMLILQGQHDFQGVMKCLKYWKNMSKFQKSFYERMKKRVNENYQKNISQVDIRKELPLLINKYHSLFKSKQSLIPNLQKYLEQIQKSSKKSDFQNAQQKQKLNPDQKHPLKQKAQSEKSNSIKSSNSTISIQSAPQQLKPIVKKPTLGMINKKENTVIAASEKILNKNTKRLTFGIKQASKNQGMQAQSKDSKKLVVQKNKNGEIPTRDIEKIEENKEKEMLGHEKAKVQKINIFERREEGTIRMNPILRTQKKEGGQQKVGSQIERSCSRSITPNKPVIQRKKIVIRKTMDNNVNLEENGDDMGEFESSFKKADEQIEWKRQNNVNGRKGEIEKLQEDKLREEIQQERKGKEEVNKRQIQRQERGKREEEEKRDREYRYKKNIRGDILLQNDRDKEGVGKRRANVFESRNQAMELQKIIQLEKQKEIQKKMQAQKKRKDDELYSALQMSILNIDLEKQNETDIYQLAEVKKYSTIINLTDTLKAKIQDINAKRCKNK